MLAKQNINLMNPFKNNVSLQKWQKYRTALSVFEVRLLTMLNILYQNNVLVEKEKQFIFLTNDYRLASCIIFLYLIIDIIVLLSSI